MLSSTTRPTGAKALSTGGGRRCCSFRAVAEIGKPNTQGVAARCPGLCAHCPFRTLTIPPPRRDVARNVSNIPADDPNGDVARNVSTDKGIPTLSCPAIKVGTQRVAFVIPSPRPHPGIMDMHQSPRAIGGTLKDLRLTSLRVVRSAIQFRGVERPIILSCHCGLDPQPPTILILKTG